MPPGPPASASASASPASPRALRHVLVVGGSGFVGGAICRSALRHGLAVSSLSRAGCSPYGDGAGPEWTRRVRWCRGDVLDERDGWTQLIAQQPHTQPPQAQAQPLPPVDAVVSCVGGFGSVATMVRVNGTANVNVFRAVSAAPQVRRIGFVSAFHYQLPTFLQRGYMEGKLMAEETLHTLVPSSPPARGGGGSEPPLSRAAVVSHTGVIYGSRYLPSLGVHLPLQAVFAPLGWLTDSVVGRALRAAPLLGPLLTPALLPPVAVDALSDALIERLMDSALTPGVHDLSVEDVRRQQQQRPQAKID